MHPEPGYRGTVAAMAYRALVLALLLAACRATSPSQTHYDVIIRGGLVYDGRGAPPQRADVAITGDRIAAIGALGTAVATTEIDARGLAVAPGFINMLSWANESLLVDGRSQADLRQGVTLEVMGEGWSMGPINETLRKEMVEQQTDIKYDVSWTTLADYLDVVVAKGIAPNVASFVGAATVRAYVLGHADRAPTADELEQMRVLVRGAMLDGALGIGSSLIYPPAFYAKTPELVELCKVAGEYGGMYITHMRSEGNRLLEGIDEVLTISREANVRAEIYHLKAIAKDNWSKMDAALAKIEAARAQGLAITANMYTYPAMGTALSATMPPWTQVGGRAAWMARLKDPATRARIAREMTSPTNEWENLFIGATPEGIILVGFKSDALKPLTGKTLAAIAKERGKPAEVVVFDLILEDDNDPQAIYFLMSEDNIRLQLARPWVSLGSDEASPAPEGVFLKANPHPRAYGTFARWLGKYTRDEHLVSLEEAIRRMTSLPAANLRIRDRGILQPRFFADVVVFDPAAIQDRATFDKPHQYATGVRQVFVNGVRVLADGEPTGKPAGRVVRGPGYRP